MSGKRVLDPAIVRALVEARADFKSHADTLTKLLSRTGGILDHHFELQSGAHAQYFLRFADVARRPEDVATIAKVFASVVPKNSVVLCPESSGVALAAALRDVLGAELAIVGVDEHRRPLPALRKGEIAWRKTFIVNDVVTTGASLARLVAVAREHKAELAGVVAFAVHKGANLGALPALEGLPIHVPLQLNWETYSAPCPLCAVAGPAIPALELN
ncbi:MAG: hypothetical protein HYS27_22770 [Deltaproteobacteria bacterium]|nr:hypothetical protein [Deltaproteobacteria bacterium]